MWNNFKNRIWSLWDGKAIWFVICLGQIQHTVKLDQIWSALRNDFQKIFDHLSTLFITIKIKQRISAERVFFGHFDQIIINFVPIKNKLISKKCYLKIIFIFLHKLFSIIFFVRLNPSIHPAQKIVVHLFFLPEKIA